MTTRAMPPALRSRSKYSRKGRSSSMMSRSRFPSIIVPRPTLVSPDFANLNPLNRINVLHPPSVPRRTVALETGTAHLHLYNRSLDMQRNQSKREHSEWKKPMYGCIDVQEGYRSGIRSILKTQINDQVNKKKKQFNDSLMYSISIFEKDREDSLTDLQRRKEKLNFLLGFTRANKEKMELEWRERKERRFIENKHEREMLKHNPINWSQTLK